MYYYYYYYALRSEDGQQLTGIADIRNRAVDFYVKLYSSEYQEDDVVFDSFCENLPTVSEETNRELCRLCLQCMEFYILLITLRSLDLE